MGKLILKIGGDKMEEKNEVLTFDVITYMREIIKKNGKECLDETVPFSGKDAMVLFSCFQRVVIVEASLLDILSKSGAINQSDAKIIREEINSLIQRVDEFAIDFLDKLRDKHNG